MSPALDQRVFDLMERLSSVVEGLRTQHVSPEPVLIGAAALFDRCHSLYSAARLLLSREYAHEAAILGRPLFMDSLVLMELAAAPDEKRRGSLVCGWELASREMLDGYYRELASRGEDVAADREQIAESIRRVRQYAIENGYSTKLRKLDADPKGLAERHGRRQEYAALLITQQFVHGATTVIVDRFQLADDGTKVVIGGTHEPTLARDTGRFTALSMLHACRATCAILGWTEPPEVEALMVEVTDNSRWRSP